MSNTSEHLMGEQSEHSIGEQSERSERDKQEQFRQDIDFICNDLKEHLSPMYHKLTRNDVIKNLFFGIQNNDISEYMKIYREAVEMRQQIIDHSLKYAQEEQVKLDHRKNTLLLTMLSQEEYAKFTVPQLKTEMSRLGVYDKSGKKADLLNRLNAWRRTLSS